MSAQAAPPAPPRHIKVRGHRIHLRLVQQVIWSAVAAAVATYIISAVYFIVTQVRYGYGTHTFFYLKHSWDHLFKPAWWMTARHDVRDVYEGVFATLFVKSLLANWRKYGERRVGPLRVATSPLVIGVAALPFLVGGIWVINFGAPWVWHHLFGHHVVHLAVSLPAWADTFLSTWYWQPLLIGVITGLVVHRLFAPVGDTVQLFFIERQVLKAQDAVKAGSNPDRYRPKFPLPPVIRERYAWITENFIPVEPHGKWVKRVIPTLTVVLALLALFGGFIRLWYAKHGW